MSKKTLDKLTILITAVGGRSVGYQILESLLPFRSIYTIISTDCDAFSPGLYESDKAYIVPEAKSPEYISTLLSIAKKNHVKAILPGSQPEVEEISKHTDVFEKENIIPLVNPYEVVKLCFDKNKMYDFLQSKGITCPRTITIHSFSEVNSLQFPIVIKPSKDSSGSRNVYIVKDSEEFKFLYTHLSMDKVQYLAQSYVGDEYHEYTIGIIINKAGEIIDSIVMKRYLTGLSRGTERVIDGKKYVLSTGYSQGFFIKDLVVKRYCEYVAKAMKARGPLNIQARKVGSKVYILEIHPRFSGSASMRSSVGFNEPHYLIHDFLGLNTPDISYKTGVAVIRRFANVAVDIKRYEQLKKKT